MTLSLLMGSVVFAGNLFKLEGDKIIKTQKNKVSYERLIHDTGELLGKNFIYSDQLKLNKRFTQVAIHSPVLKKNLLSLFINNLDLGGLTLVDKGNGAFAIIELQEIRDSGFRRDVLTKLSQIPDDARFILFKKKVKDPKAIQSKLRMFMSQQGRITPDTKEGTVLMMDKANNIKSLLSIIDS